jgi:hypothetical protein
MLAITDKIMIVENGNSKFFLISGYYKTEVDFDTYATCEIDQVYDCQWDRWISM